jgi:hypothetical protein
MTGELDDDFDLDIRIDVPGPAEPGLIPLASAAGSCTWCCIESETFFCNVTNRLCTGDCPTGPPCAN